MLHVVEEEFLFVIIFQIHGEKSDTTLSEENNSDIGKLIKSFLGKYTGGSETRFS